MDADLKPVEPQVLEDFMNGPFLQWLRRFPEAPPDLSYEELKSGIFLNNLLQSLDAAFACGLPMQNATDFHSKATNIENIIKNLKTFYQDELQQTVVGKLPDTLSICQEPPTEASLMEMDKLLLLVLGAAVQSSQKEEIIASIKTLPVVTQHAFVEKIREVTDNPERIWSSDLNDPSRIDPQQKDNLYVILVNHMRKLVHDRDHFAHHLVEMTLTNSSVANESNPSHDAKITPERNHLALEISEYKAKVRKLNQHLEERTEALNECKEEIEKYISKFSKLRQENLELTQEARTVRQLRDEIDILRERSNKVHNLETELQCYKDRISQMESLKSRLEEVKEENKILVETKEMLEDQLERSGKRCQQILSLENELFRCKSELNNALMEHESDKKRLQQVLEENLQLQMTNKSSMVESQSLFAEMQNLHKGNRNHDTNILSEQLGQELSKIHRLELENQKLRAENEELKLSGFQEASERLLKLEKENKQYSLTIQQLEASHNKDADLTVTLEKENNQLQMKTKELTEVVATMKEAEEQVRIEKDTIIASLNKQVDSLRSRQEKTQTEQFLHLEEENKKLVKERTLLQTEVSKLGHEKKMLQERLAEVKAALERSEEISSDRERLRSEVESLRRANEELMTSSESLEQITMQKEELESAYEKVSKKLEKLKSDWEHVSTENARLKQDASLFGRKFDAIKSEQHRFQQLENERDEFRDEVNRLKIHVETLSASSKKLEEQEQKLTSVTFENSRLGRQNQTLQRKMDELETENKSIEAENGKLLKTIENLKSTARRVEQLEKDNFDLESIQHKMERENKSLIREVDRLKQSVDMKDVTLEEMNSKLVNLERERNKLSRDLTTWTSEQSRNADLEDENRRLTQQSSVDKRALVKLREELVEEKLKCDSLTQQIETIGKKMQAFGLDLATLENEDSTEFISNERMKNLEGSMSQLLESREKKIKTLESTLKEIKDENQALQHELEVLKIKSDGGDNKDQLTSMVHERERLKNELSNVQMELTSTQDKIHVYEAKIRHLQEEIVGTQVENSTLQSQSTSLLSQINQLQATQAKLEATKRKLEESERVWKSEREDLLRDQAGLQGLHDNLLQDYDKLLKDKDSQKEVEKQLRDEIRKLQSMSISLNEDQEALLRAQEAINAEKESLRMDSRTLSNLRAEHARLKDDFRSLFTSNDRLKAEYCNLTTDFKALKTTLNQTKLANTELKGQLLEAKEQLTLLDVEHTKATNRCEVLTQMNMSLEEDRRSLMDQVSLLLTQYHDLLTQTMDDKEHFHQEERCFADKVNNLSRQKEKLEEKIFEQYKRMENQTPKKIGFGGQIGKYIKKAGSNLMLTSNRSRTAGPPGRSGGGPSSRVSSSSGISGSAPSSDIGRLVNNNNNNDDSSSVGSGGNESIGSGHNSPSELPRSESAIELGTRKASFTSSQLQKSSFRKSMPTHLEDSDGNNADDDVSIDSFMPLPPPPSASTPLLRKNHSLFSGSGSYHHNNVNIVTGNDDVPTRDVGPERLPNLYSQNISNSHGEVGLPIVATPDNRTRSISRVYVNGGGKDVLDRSSTPNWKGHNSTSPAPSNGSPGEITPPIVPARKHSRSSGLPGLPDRPPPQRPPKPAGGSRRTSADDNRSASDASPSIEDDVKKENTEWYEYGCV